MKKTLALIAIAAATLAAPAFAQQIYMGGAIGNANTDVDCSGTLSCNKNSTGGKLYGGYKFNPMLAAEFGYLNLGNVKASVDGASMGLPGSVDTSLKSDGFTVGLAAFLPLAPRLHSVLRGGIFAANTKMEASYSGLTVSESDSSTNAYVGFGFAYDVTRQLAIDAGVDFTRVNFKGQSSDATLWSLGVRHTF